MSELDRIKTLADKYFESLYDANADEMAAIFHPNGMLYFAKGSETTVLSRDQYIDVLSARASPRSQNAARRDELLGICINSPNVATITLRVLLSGKHYADQLSLVREQGAWRIVAKLYYLLSEE